MEADLRRNPSDGLRRRLEQPLRLADARPVQPLKRRGAGLFLKAPVQRPPLLQQPWLYLKLALVGGLLATWFLLAVRATAKEPAFERRAQEMAHLTLKIVANGGIAASAATGVTLLSLNPVLLSQPWLWAKLVLVGTMFGLHGMAAARHRRFAVSPRPEAGRFFRQALVGTAIAAVGTFVAVLVRPFA